MPLTSVNEVKIILQVSGSSYDEQISTLLPIVTSHIKNYCNNDFHTSVIGVDSYGNAGYSSSLDVVYPDGLKLAAAHMIEYILYKAKNANVAGESIGAYSVTYNSNNAYPADILEMLKPYRRVKYDQRILY